jgi:phage terminase large subunit
MVPIKSEIDGLKRETEKLRAQVGGGAQRAVLARGYDADGNVVGLYTATGELVEETDGAFYFDFIDKMLPVFFSKKRYGVLSSGRSGGKSHGTARFILMRSLSTPGRILVCRETLISLDSSMYTLLCDLIRGDDYLSTQFEIYQSRIECVSSGSEILFKGLRQTSIDSSVKSIEDISLCIVEESQLISKIGLRVLKPSIRADNSQILFLINPRYGDDPVYKEFCCG